MLRNPSERNQRRNSRIQIQILTGMKEGWEYKQLGEVCIIRTGKLDVNAQDPNGKYPFFTCDSKPYLINTYAFDDEAILISGNGSKVGHIHYYNGKFNAYQRTYVLTNFNYLSPQFLSKFLKGYLRSHIYATKKGGCIPFITLPLLKNFIIPVPPIEEQKRIVEELDLLSGIIEKQQQQLKELDTLAQSIFYDMFGDPVTNEKGLDIQLLKDGVNEMFIGPFGSALKKDCFVSEEEGYCIVYEQKHAIQKKLEFETRYITKDKYLSLKRFEVGPGDFIMSCRGTVGELFRLPHNAPKGIIHPSLMKLNIDSNIYNHIFFEWLLSTVIKYENTKGNCVQMAVTAKELGNKEVIVPPLSLQNLFASKIEAIEKQKDAITKSIAETQKLFDYTMDKYFG